MAFPDVCTIPAVPRPASAVPIPYPNIAATAAKKQQQKKTAGTQVMKPSVGLRRSSGDEPGTLKGMVSFRTSTAASKTVVASKVLVEVGQLKNSLNTLNVKLQALPARNPDEWQAVLKEYLVLASALYLAQSDDPER